MKNMRKLIPALCMLLVSAMLLSTSTFAWFTMNTAVSATGMQVKAQASGGLMIATYDGSKTGDSRFPSGFKSSVAAITTGVSTLAPVSTTNATSWYKAVAGDVASYEIKTGTTYDAVSDSEASSYYLVNHFAISTAGGSKDTENKLVISAITVDAPDSKTSKSASLNKALRVAVVITDLATTGAEDTKTLFFAPGYDSTKSDLSYTWDAVANKSKTTCNGYANIKDSKTVDVWNCIPSLASVDVYVYYEGEDTNCKSSNTANGVDTLTVAVGFKSVELEPAVSISQDASGLTALAKHVPSSKTPTYAWYESNSTTQPTQATDWNTTPIDSQTSATLADENLNGGYWYKCVITVDSKTYSSNAIQKVAP